MSGVERETCSATLGGFTCDRDNGHDGKHWGYRLIPGVAPSICVAQKWWPSAPTFDAAS